MHGLELPYRQLPGDPPDLKVDEIGRGEVDLDGINIKPYEEAADLDAFQVIDAAVVDGTSDERLVVDEVIEIDVAGSGEVDNEATIIGESVVNDCVGEKARREAILGKEVVDGGAVRGKRRRAGESKAAGDGEEEEEERFAGEGEHCEGLGMKRVEIRNKRVYIATKRERWRWFWCSVGLA